MKFKVLIGAHYQDGRLHEAGEVVESNSDLVKAHGAAKFERLPDDAKSASKPAVSKTEDKGTENAEKSATEPEKGELVDDAFDFSPEDTGLHVYKQGKLYFVYDMDDMKEPLNEKGLTKTKVLPFINSQTEE